MSCLARHRDRAPVRVVHASDRQRASAAVFTAAKANSAPLRAWKSGSFSDRPLAASNVLGMYGAYSEGTVPDGTCFDQAVWAQH